MSGRRRARNNNVNEPPPLRRRTAGGRVNIRRNSNMMAGLNQYGTFMPQRLNYGAGDNWQKQGAPRNIRVLKYSPRGLAPQNEISFNNFKNGNIAYLMFRGSVPVLYTANTLHGLIRVGPYGRHIGEVNNLNRFLSRVKNNITLFRNAGTRQNRTQKNIRKVKISMNRAARVIQRKFRSSRS